jgi:hypothetical protein
MDTQNITEATEFKNLAEAESILRHLQEDVEMIQAQLGDKRPPPDKSMIEWEAWRRDAKFAIAIKRSRLRYVKDWIRRAGQNEGAARHIKDYGMNPDESITILWALHKVARKYASERNWDISEDDRKVIDSAQWYIRKELGWDAA